MSAKRQFSQDWNPTPHEAHLSAHSSPRRVRTRYILIIIGIIVLLSLVAGTVVWVSNHNKTKPKTTNTAAQTHPQNSQGTQSGAPQTFKSDTLNISFTYPGSWRVRENADKTEVMVTLPQVTYTKGGVATDGVFTLKMRTGIVPQPMQNTLQNITAVKKSEVIAYAAPTDQQRQYTDLSFGGKGDAMSLLMVTGGSSFDVGDNFSSGLDMQGAFYLFAGGYGSDPNDTLSFDNVPINSFTGTAAYQQAVTIIESVKVY